MPKRAWNLFRQVHQIQKRADAEQRELTAQERERAQLPRARETHHREVYGWQTLEPGQEN